MSGTTPICRCRVLYLGSSVPHITKDGLQGIQEPLRDLYPDRGGTVAAKGIDSWLSVWSNGLLLENVDERKRQVTRFFPVDTLHYCAAVRYVLVPGTSGDKVQRFLPLDSPFARSLNVNHPPVFSCILRRTTGIKVLECHAFICKKETAANALVRCCFHAYADSTYARHLEVSSCYNGVGPRAQSSLVAGTVPTLDSVRKVEEWRQLDDEAENGRMSPESAAVTENYKVWHGPSHTEKELVYVDYSGTIKSVKSTAPNTPGASTIGVPDKPTRQRQRQVLSPPPALPPPNAIVSEANNNDKSLPSKTGTTRSKKSKPSKKQMQTNGNAPPMLRHPHPARHHMIMMKHPHPRCYPAHHSPRYPPNQANAVYAVPHRMMAVPHPSQDPRLLAPPPDRRFILPPPPPTNQDYSTYARHPRTMEEPTYMPQSTRAVSPVASYQPGAFNHEQYYQQQKYASNPKPEVQYQKKKKAAKQSSKNSDLESPFNTGIYKKKGHLNERAFSYSIRQEHRSRSNSLSNLKYFAENGEMPPEEEKRHQGEGGYDKKDKELAQLVDGLEVNDHHRDGHGRSNGHKAFHSQNNENFIRKKNPAYVDD